MAEQENLTNRRSPPLLLGLDDGPLKEILGFLDAASLAKTEAVSQKLRKTINPLWDKLVEQLIPSGGRGYKFWTAKERVFRWIKAREYARRMEWIGSCHFDYDNRNHPIEPAESVERCTGCTALPDLNERVWTSDAEPPEVFIRLSYREKDNEAELEAHNRVICQGFIPLISVYKYKIYFDLFNIYNSEEVDWPEMKELLDLRDTSHEAFEELFQMPNSANVENCFGNLALTVIAMESAQSWSCNLVVATGGFMNTSIGNSGGKAEFQLRCFQSHSTDTSREIPYVVEVVFSCIQFRQGGLALVLRQGALARSAPFFD